MDYQVTIIVPTYNRKAFSQLLLHNINSQSYKSIKEVIIADDGDEPLDMTGCKYPVMVHTHSFFPSAHSSCNL